MNSTCEPNVASTPTDPTDTDPLRELRREVIAEIESSEKFAALKEARPALVFSGGGGKGAYEAGAMLALFDCGIVSYSAIGGTSVGALNAALCQQLVRKRSRELVLRLWSQLNLSKVLRFTPKSLLKLALYIPISAVAHLDLLDRVKPLLGVDIEAETFREICIRTAGLAVGVAAAGLLSLASFSAMFLLLAPFFGRVGISPHLASAIAILTCTWLIPSIAGFIGRHLGIASNSPLRKTIEMIDVEDVRKGDPEVICTLSSQPGYRRTQPVAVYPSLNRTETTAAATEILLQSAALPEVFPMRKVAGDEYVDGGVADNTPIFGLAGVQTRSIIVIYLDHRMNRVLDLYKRSHFGMFFSKDQALWTRSSGLRSREVPRLREIARRRGEKWEDFEGWFYGVELIPIIPSKSLGNFITGTLNFTTRKANRLMAEGYEDTLNQIRAWCREEPVVIATRGVPDRSRG